MTQSLLLQASESCPSSKIARHDMSPSWGDMTSYCGDTSTATTTASKVVKSSWHGICWHCRHNNDKQNMMTWCVIILSWHKHSRKSDVFIHSWHMQLLLTQTSSLDSLSPVLTQSSTLKQCDFWQWQLSVVSSDTDMTCVWLFLQESVAIF